MAKEKKLTVLVPIKGTEDWIVDLHVAPTISNTVENVIYRYGGMFCRRYGDTIVRNIVDREFPRVGEPLELFSFQYDATRMGTAPTLSATVMWFEDLDSLWSQECHVIFNGDSLYLRQIPSATKSNDDARYKYEITFKSERFVLEQVYFYDAVMGYSNEKPMNQSTKFQFYGTVKELAKRLNTSLVINGLSEYKKYTQEGGTYEAPVTVKEWNDIPDKGDDGDSQKYVHFGGDYSAYLRGDLTYTPYIVTDDDGNPVVDGYRVVVDNNVELEEKMVSFDKNTIHEALQEVSETWGLQYYFTKEIDEYGNYTGTTLIVIGECEYDFGSGNPFGYGVDDALLSISKMNTTKSVVNRITGCGSSDNIPYYYPNPTPDGWIKPFATRDGEQIILIGDATKDMVNHLEESDGSGYEKYLKNKIGDVFTFGRRLLTVRPIFSDLTANTWFNYDGYFCAHTEYVVRVPFLANGSNPTLVLTPSMDEYVLGMYITIYDASNNVYGGYSNVEVTDVMNISLVGDSDYKIVLNVKTVYEHEDGQVFPESGDDYDYEGYLYPYTSWIDEIAGISSFGPLHYAGCEFYEENNLKVLSNEESRTISIDEPWLSFDSHYHKRGIVETKADGTKITVVKKQIDKRIGMRYKDLNTGIVYQCESDDVYAKGNDVYTAITTKSPRQFTSDHCSLIGVIDDSTSWYKGAKAVSLSDYGMSLYANYTPAFGDEILFKRIKYLTPQSQLMPELYYRTDGERRYYPAKNYYVDGEADEAMGEEYLYELLAEQPDDWATSYTTYYRLTEDGYRLIDDESAPVWGSESFFRRGRVKNELYKTEDNLSYFQFENEYIKQLPYEHIEDFEDIKPSITGLEYQNRRVDVAEEFAYDEHDDDTIWDTSNSEEVSGEYKHPHFFIKLRPLGFNLFDMALQEDMILSMTTGKCGACGFKIKVDENTLKNPVQIWQHDVYKYEDGGYVLEAASGDLKRYRTYKLYRLEDGNYVEEEDTSYYITNKTRKIEIITTRDILNGVSGTITNGSKTYMEGNVVTGGAFIDSQQDTTNNYVWIALEKDVNTYGTIMPSVISNYVNGEVYSTIRPTSVADTQDEDTADRFVFVNIKMPTLYIRNAEHELSRALVKYMYENNAQKFNFTIRFSRIFLAQNESIESHLNENCVLWVNYNGRVYKQFVSSYSYKMSSEEALPEITVNMNDELSVVRNTDAASKKNRMTVRSEVSQMFKERIDLLGNEMSRQYVKSSGNAILRGNIISDVAGVSVSDIADISTDVDSLNDNSSSGIKNESIDRNVVNTRVTGFISAVNTFNTGVSSRLKQIRHTMEERVLPFMQNAESNDNCSRDDRYRWNIDNSYSRLWLDEDGNAQTISSTICPANDGMTDITWTNYEQ